jgi:hypothetical protein
LKVESMYSRMVPLADAVDADDDAADVPLPDGVDVPPPEELDELHAAASRADTAIADVARTRRPLGLLCNSALLIRSSAPAE